MFTNQCQGVQGGGVLCIVCDDIHNHTISSMIQEIHTHILTYIINWFVGPSILTFPCYLYKDILLQEVHTPTIFDE